MAEAVQQVRTVRTTSFMGRPGHSSYGWDPEDDVWVLPMLRKKMAEGYVFWIVRRRPLREVRLTRIEDIGENRTVIIHDAEARELFEQGRIGIAAEIEDTEPVVERRARTAEEAVANDTVVHRPLRGG